MPLDHPNLSETAPAGVTLRRRLSAGIALIPLPKAEVLRLGVELARALAHLHAAGRLEAGLSPDSVFLTPEGRAVLLVGSAPPDADKGWVPFERASGRPQPASDLYQLGAVLLFAVTGAEPSAFGLPTQFKAAPGSLPEDLRPALESLLDPRWDRRPATALEAAEELDCLLQGKATPRQARRRTLAAALLAPLLITALGILVLKQSPRPIVPSQRIMARPVGRRVVQERQAPREEAGIWKPVRDIYPDVMGVQRVDGGVWVFSKYEAARFDAGRPEDPRKTLHDIIVVAKGDDGPVKEARSRLTLAAGVGVGEEAFAGGWEGKVSRGRLDGGSPTWPPSLGTQGRVDAMAWTEGTLYAAWQGRVWTWRADEKAWSQSPGHPPLGVRALHASPDGTVYAGGSDGLWARKGEAWRLVWKGDKPADQVRSLGEDAQGRILAGTFDGFLTLTRGGEAVARELRDRQVTAFAEGGQGRLWVGTWDGGIFVRGTGGWWPFGFAYGLPSDQVDGLAVDAKGLLWVGLYGSGLVTADEADAARAARAAKAPARLPGDVYDSLEDAARRRLVEGTPNGEVLRVRREGKDYVYFAGRQIAPPGPGCAGPDGTTARLANGLWVLERPDGGSTTLPPPRPGAGYTRSLLDRRGRLWLGTVDHGLLLYDAGAWRTFYSDAGLDGNPVTDLAEDAAGDIWVANTQPFDRAKGRLARKNLHRFDGDSWTSWSKDDGLGHWSASALRPLPDGVMAVATNGGLSVVRSGAARNYDHKDGLAEFRFFRVAADKTGRLALLDYRGGVTLAEDFKFSRVTSREGLFADELFEAAFDDDGGLWLMGRGGRTMVVAVKALALARAAR